GQFGWEIVVVIRGIISYFYYLPTRQTLPRRRFVLLASDNVVVQQFCQNNVSTLDCGFRAAIRRQSVRRSHQTRQESYLAYRKLRERLGKIELRRLPDAENPLRSSLTEVDLVLIVFQDFVFGIFAFRDERHDGFLHLAAEFALIAEEKVLHQLLGERTTTLDHASASKIDPRGAHDRSWIDAVVMIKALILDGQNG